MSLTRQQVEAIAGLARLKFSSTEMERFRAELSAVLTYVEILGEVDTTQVQETCQVTGQFDVVRDDVAKSTDPVVREQLLNSFPSRFGNYLKVKAVFFLSLCNSTNSQ